MPNGTVRAKNKINPKVMISLVECFIRRFSMKLLIFFIAVYSTNYNLIKDISNLLEIQGQYISYLISKLLHNILEA